VNLHGSLLPKYRGAAPVQWAILKGEEETGNTVIQMTPGLDAGPCLVQQRTPIGPDETAEELESRLAAMGADLVCSVIDQLALGNVRPIEQDSAEASKAPRLKKEDGAIDWSQSAEEIKNQIRAMQPWPRTFTFWHRAEGEPLRLSIDRAAMAESASAEPGTVVVAKDRLIVATGRGALELLQLQPEGRRAMPAAEFLRGTRVQSDDRFGPKA
jgi:methionyl-tRNA formyltransferase